MTLQQLPWWQHYLTCLTTPRPDLISLETGRGNPKNRDAYVLGGLFTITYHFDQVIRPKPGSCF